MAAPQGNSPLCQFGGNEHCCSGDLVSVYHEISQEHVIKGPCDFMSDFTPLIVCHHPAKFSGYAHYGSGDILVLVCHEISQYHVIKESCDFMVESPS